MARLLAGNSTLNRFARGALAIVLLLLAFFLLRVLFSTLKANSKTDKDGRLFAKTKGCNPSANGPWEAVSWDPRIFTYKKFLSAEECQHLIDIGAGELTRSTVVDYKTGKSVENKARTSWGSFLTRHRKDPVVRCVAERISRWTHLPVENGEEFYLLRYEIGQEYQVHKDWFSPAGYQTQHVGEWGQRIATVLTYLSNVDEGGETFFPKAEGGEITIKPELGLAVLFWDQTVNGTDDWNSMHGSRPVVSGTKWTMTKWIRSKTTR